MLGWELSSTSLGERMQVEQSLVGKVLSSWDMRPPMLGFSSTRVTGIPISARSREAWIPAMPPPITRTRLSIRTPADPGCPFSVTHL